MVGGQGPCSQAADRPQVDFADGGWRGTCGAAPHHLRHARQTTPGFDGGIGLSRRRACLSRV
ncbi:hypothetical protein XAR_3713 [Xanthomonas citri pv. glycines str. 8ra]|nr:hypothetical protein XAR_3713 [Xanthomonas citri pv. glycines str. 8ra]